MDHIFSPGNREYVSKRLTTRLWIFFIISIALLALVVGDVITGDAPAWMALAALAAGLVIGFFYGRFARVRWHETEDKIVMRYDAIGIIIICAYLLLSFFRDWLLDRYLSGAALEAISLAVLAGVLIGRFFGLHIAIMKVLRERKSKTS